MRLRVPALLAEHEITAYELAKRSEGRISIATAYRLAEGTFGNVSAAVLDALCDVFAIDEPGPLFERDAPVRGKRKE